MKCPYCKKETNPKSRILKYLKRGGSCISLISKDLGIKRSTLVYWIHILKGEGKIETKRIEFKSIGRPTIVRLKDTQDKKDDKYN